MKAANLVTMLPRTPFVLVVLSLAGEWLERHARSLATAEKQLAYLAEERTVPTSQRISSELSSVG